MADDKPLVIPIDSIEIDFDDFLSPETNNRIIFSGPFGIGKSYFLNKFFKNRESKYLPVFLHPVNYSLLSNEDIFKLIKYDILLQLIHNNGFKIENEFDFTKLEYASFFVGQNKFLILQNLLKLIPKIQSTVDGIENFSKLIDAFRKGKKEINEDQDLKILFEFQHETQENFLLEYDHISQFIADKLEEIGKLNDPNEPLKRVLIIDDLDRLDPEHIFRLFNVFSAHFDHVNYYPNSEDVKDNKFGFDKIIFVCDIENIRKLFAHKYGTGVDFNGYIDKFYSTRPYHFLNYSSIKNYIEKDLILKDTPEEPNYFIQIICLFLMHNKLINLRKIENIKVAHQKIVELTTSVIIRNMEVSFDEVNWIRHLSPLKCLFGSYQELITVLNQDSFEQTSIETKGITDKLKNSFIVSAIANSIKDLNTPSVSISLGDFKYSLHFQASSPSRGAKRLCNFYFNQNARNQTVINFHHLKCVLISVLRIGLDLKILNE